jgi:D-arabinose 1-dehydrogenase-like Zn-dependent alcohol dehydrogenase
MDMTQSATKETTETRTLTGRAARISSPKAGFKFEELSYKAPTGHQVRLKLEACGVCHSDSFTVEGLFPGLAYPLVPGHEIVGIVDSVGSEVHRLKPGDRVGIGWYGGHCGECRSCLSGDFITCVKAQTPGLTGDGGYAQYGIFPDAVCAKVPEGLSSAEAAPLLCAGITTYNSLRHAGAMPGDTVAIIGIGGLGHLAVQFANKMGYRTVAIARGKDKEKFAKELGAHVYLDSEDPNAVKTLADMGGAKVILATATSSKAMSPWIEGLSVGGTLLIVGAGSEPLDVSPLQLIPKRKSIKGWPSGTAQDSEDCMNFAALMGVKPMLEKFPFDKAPEAYERMMSGAARFRVVLEF